MIAYFDYNLFVCLNSIRKCIYCIEMKIRIVLKIIAYIQISMLCQYVVFTIDYNQCDEGFFRFRNKNFP